MSQAKAILEFWFGHPDESGYGKLRDFWFKATPDFDWELTSRFLEAYQKAAAGLLNEWVDSPESCLALILLLDQFPRNMFRGTPQAYSTDWEALSVAQQAVAKGYDREFLPVQRWFIYLPFEHSENLEDQRRCIKLFEQLSHDRESAIAIKSAFQHLQIIERFGRFPHRNVILGRPSTPEEIEFLKQPDSSF